MNPYDDKLVLEVLFDLDFLAFKFDMFSLLRILILLAKSHIPDSIAETLEVAF